jgi:tripartite-type tricarboxylate transporter receptor subunit TctC
MRRLTRTRCFSAGAGAFCSLAILMASIAPSHAQESYPSKPIRLVVPYPPGAVTDSVSRIIAAELGKVIGQTVIVENKPGANTLVGTQAVRYAPADGYTLLYQSNTLVTNLYAVKQPGYVLQDFKPVGMLSQSAFVLMVSAKNNLNSLKDYIDYGKANPGKLNVSTIGPGSAASVIAHRLGQAAGIEWTEIPFKGGAEATQAVMSGDTHAFAASQGAPLIHANLDKMRMAAITAEKRSEFLPDVPTFKELGYPSVTYESWSALFVRSETPAPIVAKLASAITEAMKSPTTQEQFRKLSVPPYDGGIEDMPATLEKELEDFKLDAKKQGLEPQ